ncbi:unnamed protein product [Moneuplotes crassus]|uniref:Uncharacterized protein n=1 Tax=Euplotes crassus TaxID=5936 RepID=A0AAD1XGE1_EUPCR|nr:unnamed protein product [Moneuplotes crassus]
MNKNLRKSQEQIPNNKLSRIEEHDNSSSDDEQDEDDIFLQDLERENQMLEGVLKDLQGVIQKEKNDYSFEQTHKPPNNHFTSVKRLSNRHSPAKQASLTRNNESRIPRPSTREPKHRFNNSSDNEKSRERTLSSRRPYLGDTISSKIRNTQTLQLDDPEQESMELEPPVPHDHIKIQSEAIPAYNRGDTDERSAADKIRSLELRLVGTKKSIQSLEKDKRDKDNFIKQLQHELDKAKRFNARSENTDPNLRQKKGQLNASVSLQQRKKERSLEDKIKELEAVIHKDRKHMARLQSLNTQLITKIKGVANSEKSAHEESTNYGNTLKSLRRENSYLKQNKREILEEYKELKHSFNVLADEHEELKARHKSLAKQSKIFEENALELYESHQLLTEKLMKYHPR